MPQPASEFCPIPNQIEFWAKVGKCALDNPDLPIDFVKDILISKNQDRSLAEPFNFENETIRAVIKNPKLRQEKRTI